jgi:hypothetical protein
MSSNNRTNLLGNQKVYVCADGSCTAQAEPTSSATRDLFTRQTGQALITLGEVFVNVPPFNDHIDQSTGKMLISIGRKLKKK